MRRKVSRSVVPHTVSLIYPSTRLQNYRHLYPVEHQQGAVPQGTLELFTCGMILTVCALTVLSQSALKCIESSHPRSCVHTELGLCLRLLLSKTTNRPAAIACVTKCCKLPRLTADHLMGILLRRGHF